MSRKPRCRQSQRLDAHASRDAADASPRRTGSALPLHRRDGLGRYEDARLGCPLRSSKRGHRIRVVCGEANAGIVEDHHENACKGLQRRSVARHGVRASPRRSRSVTFRSPPCVWDAVRRVRRSVSRVGERRRGEMRIQNPCKSVENGCERSLLAYRPPASTAATTLLHPHAPFVPHASFVSSAAASIPVATRAPAWRAPSASRSSPPSRDVGAAGVDA